jgi:hypothetical protein
MKAKIVTERQAAERLKLIRRENVKRHNEHAARTQLKSQQKQRTNVTNMQMQLDSLHEASVRGSGLDSIRINQMGVLKKILSTYK